MKYRIIEKKAPHYNPIYIPQYKFFLFWNDILSDELIIKSGKYEHLGNDIGVDTYNHAEVIIKEFKTIVDEEYNEYTKIHKYIPKN